MGMGVLASVVGGDFDCGISHFVLRTSILGRGSEITLGERYVLWSFSVLGACHRYLSLDRIKDTAPPMSEALYIFFSIRGGLLSYFGCQPVGCMMPKRLPSVSRARANHPTLGISILSPSITPPLLRTASMALARSGTSMVQSK